MKQITLLIVGLAGRGVSAAHYEHLIGPVSGRLVEKPKNPVYRAAAVNFARTR